MKRWLRRLGLIGLALMVLGVGGLLYAYREFVRPGPLASPATIVLPRGGVETLARALEQGHVIRDARLFVAGRALLGGRRPLKAREYSVPIGLSAADVMRLLQEGRTVVRHLTIPEGLTTRQILGLIAAADGLDGPLPATPPT